MGIEPTTASRPGRAPWPAVLLAALAVAAGCVRNPATGEKQLVLASEEREIAMAREGARQVASTMGLYGDDERQADARSGSVRGRASFVDHGGRTYRLLGYAGAGSYPRHERDVRAFLASFERLTDPEALALLNALESGERVPAGRSVKWVSGPEPPWSSGPDAGR